MRRRSRIVVEAIAGAAIVAVSFAATHFMLQRVSPVAKPKPGRPALVAVPPLEPLTGTSTVLAPASSP